MTAVVHPAPHRTRRRPSGPVSPGKHPSAPAPAPEAPAAGSSAADVREVLVAALDARVESLDRDQGHPADHRAAIAQIATALAQLADGTYGTCLGCANPIEGDRLLDDPATSTCGACAGHVHHLIG